MRSLSDTSSPSKTTGAAPLKVLHVGKFYPPHFGGMESHLQTLCEELSKSIEVQVLVASDQRRTERSTQGGVEVARLATPLMLHGTPIVPLMARAMSRARRKLCRVIPFGIRAGDFVHPDATRVAEVRRRHGERIVLGVGRLIYYKGFENLVRAMVDVRAAALIAGEGQLSGALAAEAERLGVADRVVLLGRVNDADLKACYHACEVFALPSVERSEAFGIVQLEAMACGKPVVNTWIDSAVPHVSLDGVTGLTVPPGDPTALAAALNALLDDPARRAAMGAAGRQRVREEFSAELMARRTLEVYREIAPGAARWRSY